MRQMEKTTLKKILEMDDKLNYLDGKERTEVEDDYNFAED